MFKQGVTVVYRYLGNDRAMVDEIDEIIMTREEGNETRE